MTRDIAKKLKYEKPSCIFAKFFPAITGLTGKMSASDASTTIYLSDKPNQVKNKIKKYAFSGGGVTKEEHEKNGANLKIDVPYQFLEFFFEDDEELARIAEEYSSGRMMTGEIKQICADAITEFITEYQERRANVTDEDVELFTSVRQINPVSSKLPPKPENKKEDS